MAFAHSNISRKDRTMRFLTAALCAAGLLVSVNSAQAAGCLSGAVVGGVAGHAVHHGVMGAVAGCAYGHHLHKEQERKKHEEDKAKQQHPTQ
jgi:outer membrane lipoprotein SlyB